MGLFCSEMMSIDPLLEDVVRAWDDLSEYVNGEDVAGDGSAYGTADRADERHPAPSPTIRLWRLAFGA